MLSQFPGKCAFLKLYDGGHQSYDLDSPPLVSRHIEPVNVGLGAQTTELEIHLAGVLARAGEHFRHHADVLPPPLQLPKHETAVPFRIILGKRRSFIILLNLLQYV